MEEQAKAAALAAYHNLTCRVAVEHACVKVAEMVTQALSDLRAQHGMGHMLMLAQSSDRRWPVVQEVCAALPENYALDVTPAAVHDAVGAAAHVLAKG